MAEIAAAVLLLALGVDAPIRLLGNNERIGQSVVNVRGTKDLQLTNTPPCDKYPWAPSTWLLLSRLMKGTVYGGVRV